MSCACGDGDDRPPPLPPGPLGLGVSHPEDPEDSIEYAKETMQIFVINLYRSYRDLGYNRHDAVLRASNETKVRVKVVRHIIKRYDLEQEKKAKENKQASKPKKKF